MMEINLGVRVRGQDKSPTILNNRGMRIHWSVENGVEFNYYLIYLQAYRIKIKTYDG